MKCLNTRKCQIFLKYFPNALWDIVCDVCVSAIIPCHNNLIGIINDWTSHHTSAIWQHHHCDQIGRAGEEFTSLVPELFCFLLTEIKIWRFWVPLVGCFNLFSDVMSKVKNFICFPYDPLIWFTWFPKWPKNWKSKHV